MKMRLAVLFCSSLLAAMPANHDIAEPALAQLLGRQLV